MTTVSSSPSRGITASRPGFVFSPRLDALAFGGSALASFALLGLGAVLGLLHADTPPWLWLACVVFVDVAHVWSTALRVYFDREELARRPLLYLGTPLVLYALGVALHLRSPLLFWRVLAYVAVFHFVRQQAGWLAIYHRRDPALTALDRHLDRAAVYSATLYPLLVWHASLPRRFSWFVTNDFVSGLSASVVTVATPLYFAVMLAFVLRQGWLAARNRPVSFGKPLLVITTALCWYVGIVTFDSDYAFTVTNVLIHGVPYMVLTTRYAAARAPRSPSLAWVLRFGVLPVLLAIFLVAFFEEALWDRLVWHDHPAMFGHAPSASSLAVALIAPLLALPQATHYVLDGFVWRMRANPLAREALAGHGAPQTSP